MVQSIFIHLVEVEGYRNAASQTGTPEVKIPSV